MSKTLSTERSIDELRQHLAEEHAAPPGEPTAVDEAPTAPSDTELIRHARETLDQLHRDLECTVAGLARLEQTFREGLKAHDALQRAIRQYIRVSTLLLAVITVAWVRTAWWRGRGVESGRGMVVTDRASETAIPHQEVPSPDASVTETATVGAASRLPAGARDATPPQAMPLIPVRPETTTAVPLLATPVVSIPFSSSPELSRRNANEPRASDGSPVVPSESMTMDSGTPSGQTRESSASGSPATPEMHAELHDLRPSPEWALDSAAEPIPSARTHVPIVAQVAVGGPIPVDILWPPVSTTMPMPNSTEAAVAVSQPPVAAASQSDQSPDQPSTTTSTPSTP